MSEAKFNRKNALKAALLGGLGAASIYAANESHAGKVFHGQNTLAESALEHNLTSGNVESSREGLTNFFFDRLTTNGLLRKHSRLELTKVAKLQALVAGDYVASLSELEDLHANPEMSRRLARIEREILGAEVLAKHTDNFFGETNRGRMEVEKERLYQASVSDPEDPWLAPEPDLALLDLNPARINLAPDLVAQYAPALESEPVAETPAAEATPESAVEEITPQPDSAFPFLPFTLAGGSLGLGYFAWNKRRAKSERTNKNQAEKSPRSKSKVRSFREELVEFRAKRDNLQRQRPGISFPRLSEQALKFPTFQAWAQKIPSPRPALERLRRLRIPNLPPLNATIEITIPGPQDIYRAVTARLPRLPNRPRRATQEQVNHWQSQYAVLQNIVDRIQERDESGQYSRAAQYQLLEVRKAIDERRLDTAAVLEKYTRKISIIDSALHNLE